ncbi:tyrosine-type recombinase/integrase [Phycisphaerales bacterium AB-hyl4]|uniref:Tyrosine-type recombinase/integrase n=1 Tax=Natronomicrosphaera hydrolytica TaxID=3242702 RepID=A0ABV4U740_9BACT
MQYWPELTASSVQGAIARLTQSARVRDEQTGESKLIQQPLKQRSRNHYLTVAKSFCNWMVADGRAFNVPANTAGMLRQDLKAAGVAYETAQGVFDFHALRTTFCTTIGQSGASMETVRTLARHASITTTQRYLRTDDQQQVAALSALPTITIAPAAAAQTGTHDAAALTALLTAGHHKSAQMDAPLCAIDAESVEVVVELSAKENPVKNGVFVPSRGKAERAGFENPLYIKNAAL